MHFPTNRVGDRLSKYTVNVIKMSLNPNFVDSLHLQIGHNMPLGSQLRRIVSLENSNEIITENSIKNKTTLTKEITLRVGETPAGTTVGVFRGIVLSETGLVTDMLAWWGGLSD